MKAAILIISINLAFLACQRTNASQSCEQALEHVAELSTARLSNAEQGNASRHAANIARGARTSFLSRCRGKREASRNDYVACVLDADDISSARSCQR